MVIHHISFDQDNTELTNFSATTTSVHMAQPQISGFCDSDMQNITPTNENKINYLPLLQDHSPLMSNTDFDSQQQVICAEQHYHHHFTPTMGDPPPQFMSSSVGMVSSSSDTDHHHPQQQSLMNHEPYFEHNLCNGNDVDVTSMTTGMEPNPMNQESIDQSWWLVDGKLNVNKLNYHHDYMMMANNNNAEPSSSRVHNNPCISSYPHATIPSVMTLFNNESTHHSTSTANTGHTGTLSAELAELTLNSLSNSLAGTTIHSDGGGGGQNFPTGHQYYFHHHPPTETVQSGMTANSFVSSMNSTLASKSTSPIDVSMLPTIVQAIQNSVDQQNTTTTHRKGVTTTVTSPRSITTMMRWKCPFPPCKHKHGCLRKRDLIKRHIIPYHCGVLIRFKCHMHEDPKEKDTIRTTNRLDTAMKHMKDCYERVFKSKPGNQSKPVPAKVPKKNYKILDPIGPIPCPYKDCSFIANVPKEISDHIYGTFHRSNIPRL
ncbi:hypothetical protein BDA99DRAFT_285509 [Phascolomyces articulosus]|uniref:Uncharacterized protein n=1 Tax=Phascolomyces articulosus TaxID=60185 RepID=A0AAD5P7L5_9FUNG|nr:hypothetical protein BDA99DRAFT_285509 [Phascolomyces articulosus]